MAAISEKSSEREALGISFNSVDPIFAKRKKSLDFVIVFAFPSVSLLKVADGNP